jgi:hypothetical protein
MTAEMTDTERKSWLAIRKEAAFEIDPETAVVTWWYVEILDPYGVDPNLPKECHQIGRVYFARSSGSDVWISFYDLPDAVCKRLWERIEAGDFDNDDLTWLFDGDHARGVDPVLASSIAPGCRDADAAGPKDNSGARS